MGATEGEGASALFRPLGCGGPSEFAEDSFGGGQHPGVSREVVVPELRKAASQNREGFVFESWNPFGCCRRLTIDHLNHDLLAGIQVVLESNEVVGANEGNGGAVHADAINRTGMRFRL